MLVGIGSRQTIDFSSSTVTNYNDNKSAILHSLASSFPSTWTPLSESLHETARYLAQINSTYLPAAYVYPIAYSPGVAFATNGVGSIGAAEISALSAGETCPAPPGPGVASYIANACGRDPYFFGSNHAPPWASPSIQVTCCKTYVLLVTDGEPTQDTNIPAALQDYGHGRHGVHCTGSDASSPTAPINATCNTHPATTAPYLIGASPTTTATSGEHKTDYASSGNHYLDDVAYWAHTNDLRPCTNASPPADGTIAVLNVTGHCLPGFQNLTLYTFFAFGNIAGRELLMHSAQLGGFEDSNGNNVPDLVSEWDATINATGAKGSDGIPDNYFESSDVNDLQDRLLATVTAIISRSASGTSVSVLASSSTGEGSVYQAYFFTSDVGLGGANVRWAGYTQGLFIDAFGNLREDTVHDAQLVYTQDLIIKTRYDNNPGSPTFGSVFADRFQDLNGDGQADSATPMDSIKLKNLQPIWEAGKQLALRDSTTRKVLTWTDPNSNGIVDAGEQIPFHTSNCAALRDYLRYAGDACSGGTPAMNLINFIRGDEISGLRTRMLEVPIGSGSYKSWKLGDPIHSTPTVVSLPSERYDLRYGDKSYNDFYQQYAGNQRRREVIYVGANDGMLHAFNGGFYYPGGGTGVHGRFLTQRMAGDVQVSNTPALGEELWAFVPMQLLPQLQWLARPDYTHVYYVDLKPTVTDARIFPPDADHPGGWGTILIGGFRLGGSCGSCVAAGGAPPMTATIGGVNKTFYSAYFVLDVTNPEVDPKLLWVFTDSGLGLTTNYPTVVRMNPKSDGLTSSANEKWYVVFGSGPNGYSADLSLPATVPSGAQAPPFQTAKLYVGDLKNGPGSTGAPTFTTIPVGTFDSFLGHPVSFDRDLDWRTDAVYFGRTLSRTSAMTTAGGATPRGTNSADYRGKFYRLTTSGCTANTNCSPNTWGISLGGNRVPTEMLETYLTSGAPAPSGPISTAPEVTIDDSNNVWVFFGTGRYWGNADKVDNTIQHLFGLKDRVFSGCDETAAPAQQSCWSNDLVDVTNAVVSTNNTITDTINSLVTTFSGSGTTSMTGLVQSKHGWRVTLPGPYTDPVTNVTYSAERSVVSPTLAAGTIFFPTFAPTNDYCASTGTSNLYVLFYKTGTAATTPVIGTSGNTVNNKTYVGAGMASSMTVHIGMENGGGTGLIQLGTAQLDPTSLNLSGNYSKYIGWIHQRD